METFTFERVYIPSVELGNIINMLAETTATQKDVASMYADCIRSDPTGKKWDCKAVNAAILARWPKGLERIKKLAWKELQHRKAK